MAKALGITVPQLFKETSDGAIGAARALRGLRDVFNEIAAEQIVASMQALAAALGRLKIEADLAGIAFGDAADEGFRKVVETVTQLTRDLQPLASELGSLASDSILHGRRQPGYRLSLWCRPEAAGSTRGAVT